jgi:hypothetical protein
MSSFKHVTNTNGIQMLAPSELAKILMSLYILQFFILVVFLELGIFLRAVPVLTM